MPISYIHLLTIYKVSGTLREVTVEKLILVILRFMFSFNTNVCDLEALQKHKDFCQNKVHGFLKDAAL